MSDSDPVSHQVARRRPAAHVVRIAVAGLYLGSVQACVAGSEPNGGYDPGFDPANDGVSSTNADTTNNSGGGNSTPTAPNDGTPSDTTTSGPGDTAANDTSTNDSTNDPASTANDNPANDPGNDPVNDGDPPIAPDGYRVVGPQIVDADGNPKVFYGINRPSFEWSATGEGNSSVYASIAAWGANVVRIPLNSSFWNSNQNEYQAQIGAQVSLAEGVGLDVILDLHRNGGTDQTSDDNRFAKRSAIGFWTSVASQFGDDGRVLFELYNEPHDVAWSTWRSGDGEFAGMQEMYDAVRETGADNLVLVGGLNWAYDLTGIGSGLSGYNIAYVSHIYDKFGKQPSDWPTYVGHTADKFPVLLTEFGTDDGNCDSSFESQVIDWADQRQVSWVAWAWYPGGCGFPSLIDDWNGNPTQKGQLIQSKLMSR